MSPERALADLKRAAELEPSEWRFGKALAERYIRDGSYVPALEVAQRYTLSFPENCILGMLHARTLLLNARVGEAAAVLDRLNVLPFEGSTDGRTLYREAQLLLGAEAFRAGDIDAAARRVAAAREWPEHLGAGKPYPEDVDERVEDWMAAQCLERAGKTAEARALLERLATASKARGAVGGLLSATALAGFGEAGRRGAGIRRVGGVAGGPADHRLGPPHLRRPARKLARGRAIERGAPRRDRVAAIGAGPWCRRCAVSLVRWAMPSWAA